MWVRARDPQFANSCPASNLMRLGTTTVGSRCGNTLLNASAAEEDNDDHDRRYRCNGNSRVSASPAGAKPLSLLLLCCPFCQDSISLPRPDGPACSCGAAKVQNSILTFGRGYATSIVEEHRRNLDQANLQHRHAFDIRYAAYCDAAFRALCNPSWSNARALSLGCGLGFEVLKLKKLGYDAYGFEVADLASIWTDQLTTDAWRCVLNGDGRLPFRDASFDLITCVNVFEHVGTTPPNEVVSNDTPDVRDQFIAQAFAKLRPGGLLVLTCPNRAYPFDAGHSHAYLDESAAEFSERGFTYVDPFDPRNFLPSWGDIVRACVKITQHEPICLGGLMDRYLFGLGGPESQASDYEQRLRHFSTRWAEQTGEPEEMAQNPHIQAFIRKADEIRSSLLLDGTWRVEWIEGGATRFIGTWSRQAFLPTVYAAWYSDAGLVETDLMRIVSPESTAHCTLSCSSIEKTLVIHLDGDTLTGHDEAGTCQFVGRRTSVGLYRGAVGR